MDYDSALVSGASITLPLLELPPETIGCGRVSHVLRDSSQQTVQKVSQASISPRRVAPLLELANGERVLITDADVRKAPSGADGVLRPTEHGFVWRNHKLIDAARAVIGASGAQEYASTLAADWPDLFRARSERSVGGVTQRGLRPPQHAALYTIAAHWMMERNVATVVMPTGVGKTETMLGSIVQSGPGTYLIVVPTDALRRQTLHKVRTLGLLKALGLLGASAHYPVVGLVLRRPRSSDDLAFLPRCNIVVATVSSLADGSAAHFLDELATKCTHLIVDEAHHVRASTWSRLRSAFRDRHVLQFTATPFREDGQEVDGRMIFKYGLAKAQADGYFKPVHFRGIAAGDGVKADRVIAETALDTLHHDCTNGSDHLVMARCSTIQRAQEVHDLYTQLAPALSPLLIHSKLPRHERDKALNELRQRASRIVVCVDMLGEGFDLPNLKIAALHDLHKSLSVLLQFTGRFTRVGEGIGDATVVANIDAHGLDAALERLYSEDADWNLLLAEHSSAKIIQQEMLLRFLEETQSLHQPSLDDPFEVSGKTIRPTYSTVVFHAEVFEPRKFFEALPRGAVLKGAWLNEQRNVLWFTTLSQDRVRWTRAEKVLDTVWDLFVLYYNAKQGSLFIHSSDSASMHVALAKVVGGGNVALHHGDGVFRCFGHLKRLVFQSVGLKTRGRMTLRYSMFVGADVAAALSPAQTGRSERTNFFGTGYERGEAVSVGCSYKGRIWSRETGSVYGFTQWCDGIGAKLLDTSITTDDVLKGALLPKEITSLPQKTPLALNWPAELLMLTERQIQIGAPHELRGFHLWSLEMIAYKPTEDELHFRLISNELSAVFRLTIDESCPSGYSVHQTEGPALAVRVGRKTLGAIDFLMEQPPVLLFTDGSELEGIVLAELHDWHPPAIPADRMHVWDWSETDITVESRWRNGVFRSESIQERVAADYLGRGFDIIFDDDDAGEAADLVCIADRDERIELHLVHCKFSGEPAPGHRIADVVQVSSQAVRSARWTGKFEQLMDHLRRRERSALGGRSTRFIQGTLPALSTLKHQAKFKQIEMKVVVVQPGLRKGSATADQLTLLCAAHGYLLDITSVGLDVICSA